MKLGPVLASYRHANKITLRDLSEEIGVPVASLTRIEHGYGCTSENLGVVLAWLLTETPVKPNWGMPSR
jgi:cytoskeletal protein RodZ